MTLHRLALAAMSFALAACSAPSPPADADGDSVPVATADPAAPAAQEPPMGKRAAGDDTPPMQVFRALGTEPFWNVNVEGDTLTFTTPEDQDGTVMQGARREVDSGVEIAGSHDGKTFVLALSPGACSDGMSDNRYQWVASFRFGDIDYKGCGEAAK